MADEIRTKLFECGLVMYYSCSKTPCSRAPVQKLIVAQLLKKYPSFCGIRRFNGKHAIGLYARWNQSTSANPIPSVKQGHSFQAFTCVSYAKNNFMKFLTVGSSLCDINLPGEF